MTDYEKDDEKQELQLGALWRSRIQKAHKALKGWRREAKSAYEAYWLDEKHQEKFPLFWANTQIQHSAVFAQAPTAEVRRRNTEVAGPHRELSQGLERAINYQFDIQDTESAFNAAVDDFLIAACGLVRVHYDPELQTDENGVPVAILSQGLSLEHVPYARLTWEPNKNWTAVDWVAIEHMLSKREFQDQFPGKPCPEASISGEGDAGGDGEQKNPEAAKYAPLYRVWEVFDKKTRTVVVIAEGEDEPLEVRQDELGLNGFYPFARPMMMNLKKDELIPKPEYVYIKPQLQYINRLTGRIEAITGAIKDVGFYDDSLTELQSLKDTKDGDMIPLRALAERLASASGARLENLIAKMPIDQLSNVLSHLREMREDAKAQIYEITGISDLVRGVSDPDETATAQREKSQWAGARFGIKEREVIRHVRDTVRLMGEVVSEHFEPSILTQMTGTEFTPEMVQIMRNDLSRAFSVDIETDSTILADEKAERQDRMEFLTAVSEFLPSALESINNQPATAQLMQQMLLFLVRSFKHGRQLEDEIEAMAQQMDPMQQMQQQIQDLQGQLDQGAQDLQAAQDQLAQVDQAENAREDQVAMVEGAETQADTRLKHAEAALKERELMTPTVVPFGA